MATSFKKIVALAALAAATASASAAPSLLGLYLLDGNGNNAAGSGPNLTAEGNGNISYVAGLSGQAASFDGSGANWLRAAINGSGDSHPSFTWGAWVRLNDPGAWNIFLSNDNGGWDRFTQSNNGYWSLSNGGGVQNSGSGTSAAWTFVAQTFDGVTQKLYVNGALVLSAADAAHDSQHFIDIGRNANGAMPLSGQMDSVFFFDSALASDQIATAYAGGAGGNGVRQLAGLGGNAVPEPTGLALVGLGLGLAAAGLAARQRRPAA